MLILREPITIIYYCFKLFLIFTLKSCGILNNYRLNIQYDGTRYAGWQIQKNVPTIQQTIRDAIKTLLKENVNLIGSGRTDAGVHALGQAANFRTEVKLDLFKFTYSLNSILPPDISIIYFRKVDAKFHARFDAKKRSYIYLLSKQKSPFYKSYSYFYHGELNCITLNKLSLEFLGEHDFTSFARKNTDTNNKVCNVYNIAWKDWKGLVIFKIEADRFLHGMVRTIVGTVLKASKNNFDRTYIKNVLVSQDRVIAGEAVPAKGLFLYKVKY